MAGGAASWDKLHESQDTQVTELKAGSRYAKIAAYASVISVGVSIIALIVSIAN